MPPLPSPGNVIKANLLWGVEGDLTAETIHFFSYSGAAGSGDLSTFASSLVSNADTQFAALVNTSSGMQSATCRDLATSMGAEVTAGTPWTGTRSGGATPPAACVVVAHSIARHYRGGHPRTYLPVGSATDVVAAGTWNTTFLGDVDTAWGLFISGVIDTYGGLTIQNLVNVSYFGPPNRIITSSTGRVRTVSTMRGVPIVDQVTGHVARKLIGSQRRRNRDA